MIFQHFLGAFQARLGVPPQNCHGKTMPSAACHRSGWDQRLCRRRPRWRLHAACMGHFQSSPGKGDWSQAWQFGVFVSESMWKDMWLYPMIHKSSWIFVNIHDMLYDLNMSHDFICDRHTLWRSQHFPSPGGSSEVWACRSSWFLDSLLDAASLGGQTPADRQIWGGSINGGTPKWLVYSGKSIYK